MEKRGRLPYHRATVTQPAHTNRPALPAASVRAAKSWWACR